MFVTQVSPRSVASSGAMRRDLDFIRLRHVFLDRAGLYRLPPERTLSTDVEASPAVGEVLVAGDRAFLARTAGGLFDEADYALFQEVLRRERELAEKEANYLLDPEELEFSDDEEDEDEVADKEK